jgi:hypothetical protein
MMRLLDVVTNLSEYDEELTIYAKEPWTCDSEAVVAREPDTGGVPPDAAGMNASYFIEIFVAKEFLEGWRANIQRDVSAEEQCDRLIYYAVHDA